MVLPVPAKNALYNLQMMDHKVRLDEMRTRYIRYARFLHFVRPFVAGVAKGPGRLEASENASARDHIFSRVLRLYAKSMRVRNWLMAWSAWHTPLDLVRVAPGLIFREDLHAPLARAILTFFPNPCDGTAIPCTGYVKIAS